MSRRLQTRPPQGESGRVVMLAIAGTAPTGGERRRRLCRVGSVNQGVLASQKRRYTGIIADRRICATRYSLMDSVYSVRKDLEKRL